EYARALFWEALLAFRIFVTHGFDAVHLCNPPDMLFLITLPYKLLGRKVMFDHHDLSPELFLAKFGKKNVIYRIMVLLEKLTFRTADRTIATNESYRRIALTRGGKKPDQVTVVRSGPSSERMRITEPVPALKKGRRIMVGYVGVIGRQEGLHFLVEACAVIVKEWQRSDLHFMVVGSGPALSSIRRTAVQKGVADFFTFTGRVPDDELVAALNTADICVNTDEYNEMNDKSTMNKIMEYMSLKKPIVQFDLTEGRVSAGDASLYARPNDARDLAKKIIELADDQEKRRRMGLIGYERVHTFLSWRYQEEHLIDAYRKLFAGNGGGETQFFEELFRQWKPVRHTRDGLYDRYARLLEEGGDNIRCYPMHRQFAELLRPGAEKILDCACGAGELAIWLALNGKRVSAFDVSERAVRIARESAALSGVAERIDFRIMDVRRLDYPSNHFDLLTGLDSLHHLIKFPSGIRELARVLKPGGRAVFSEPLAWDPVINLLRKINVRRKNHVYEHFLTRKDMRLLERIFGEVRTAEHVVLSAYTRFIAKTHAVSRLTPLQRSICVWLRKVDTTLLRFFPGLRKRASMAYLE
ncbi:MAG TPA: glycosyltransferase, partial [Spirochaetia bacterium]|nr:glycosyltransferase [Spirochaetia bacterium]